MNKKLFSGLSIFAVAFAFVLGFGAINQTLAASGSYNHDYGQAVLIGVDEADNSIGALPDRDINSNLPTMNRGLSGDYSEER